MVVLNASFHLGYEFLEYVKEVTSKLVLEFQIVFAPISDGLVSPLLEPLVES